MNLPRVITKTKGRRLYDTTSGQYVTLVDLACLVKSHEDVLVLDRQTQRDVTSSVLLQIIIDLENRENLDAPIMSRDFLGQVIRSDAVAMRALVSTYLEQSIRLLADRTKKMRGADPAHLAKECFDLWKSARSVIYRKLRSASDDAPETGKKTADGP
jgi:polyhydroxyalkanoate synthesis repressor PhaR